MKIVQITSGGYGLKRENGLPTKLILRGEVVQLDDAEAERLVDGGFAAYCETGQKQETVEAAQPKKKPHKPATKRAGVQ